MFAESRPEPDVIAYRLVRGDAGRDGALRAAVAGESGARDLDLVRVGAVSPAIGAGLGEGRGGRERGKEEGERAHIELFGSELRDSL